MEERQKKEPLIILTGPTAVGKTALSLKPVSYPHLDVYKTQVSICIILFLYTSLR